MCDSVEYRILSHCHYLLVAAFQDHPHYFTESLLAVNVIDILDPFSPFGFGRTGDLESSGQRANRLVYCLIAKVRTSSIVYHRFIGAISQVPWLSDIVDQLNLTYRKFNKISMLK